MKKIPIIIDTDPGVDDTTALFMCLASQQLDIKGITTVGGNVELQYTSTNAKNIVYLAGRSDIPVLRGAEKPLKRVLETASHIHGIKGMGSLELKESSQPFYDEEVTDFIYRMACQYQGDLRILTLGPMTNMANTLLKYPDIEGKLHSITSMGGAMGVGNVTPAAEYNIFADPHGANIVFKSRVKTIMVGLDVTIPTIVTPNQNDLIRQINNPVAKVVADLNDYLLSKENPYNSKGAIMHDPLAAATILQPDLVTLGKYYVEVVEEEGKTVGLTLVDKYGVTGHEPNVYVALEADNEKFIDLLDQLLRQYGS